MVALLALGVMSVGCMVFIAALIAFEKLLPWKELTNRSIAVMLVVLGIGVAFTPQDVPGLTVPGDASGPAMHMQPRGESMKPSHDPMGAPSPGMSDP